MELILAVACEDARTRPDGRLDLVGVFDELSAPGFPARQDRMTVVFIMEWAPGQDGRRPRTRLVMPLERVVFPRPGEYRFRLTVAGETIPAFPLFLSEQPERS